MADPHRTGMAAQAPGPPLVIFTDLDGTFLAHDTYSFQASVPAYRRCRGLGVPVIFTTSKTRVEVERLRESLDPADPFIVENGGAVFVPRDHFPIPIPRAVERGCYLVLELGIQYQDLTRTLDRLSLATGVAVKSFHQMTIPEIAQTAGLPEDEAALAARREYDEPFAFRGGDPAKLLAAIDAAGLHWTRGSRFYHLFGHEGKGVAVEALADLYRRWNPSAATVGLGDSPNDVPMLRAIELPVLVQRPGGEYDPETLSAVPAARLAPGPGPEGWNAAVEALLDEFGLKEVIHGCSRAGG